MVNEVYANLDVMREGPLGECNQPGHQAGPETWRNVQEEIATDYLSCGRREEEGMERRGINNDIISHPGEAGGSVIEEGLALGRRDGISRVCGV